MTQIIYGYNDAIKVINNPKIKSTVKTIGEMILSQYNTAGGSTIMKEELHNFVENNKKLLS